MKARGEIWRNMGAKVGGEYSRSWGKRGKIRGVLGDNGGGEGESVGKIWGMLLESVRE